ncbi:MAG: hypothetical protein Q7T54_02950 [Candidatus Levybacteria bacterium]|nr:hypothetical protein [Candidatus Levybacteria bacterium]
MEKSQNLEELEINFAAFVVSARSVTFVLQEEFSKNKKFINWYGKKEDPKKGTKRFEMKNDNLCKFFVETRNNVEKKGITGIQATAMKIQSFDSTQDIKNKPDGIDGTIIRADGIFLTVYSGTPKADIISAVTTATFSSEFILKNTPTMHLSKNIGRLNFFDLSKLYYEYLKGLVEEATEIVNS